MRNLIPRTILFIFMTTLLTISLFGADVSANPTESTKTSATIAADFYPADVDGTGGKVFYPADVDGPKGPVFGTIYDERS